MKKMLAGLLALLTLFPVKMSAQGIENAQSLRLLSGNTIGASLNGTSTGMTVNDQTGFAVKTVNTNGELGKIPAIETIAAGGTITANACGGIKRITAASAVTTDTTNTFTAPVAALDGCIMTVQVVAAAAGSNVTLDANTNFQVAANIVMKSSDTMTVGVSSPDGSNYYWVLISSAPR